MKPVLSHIDVNFTCGNQPISMGVETIQQADAIVRWIAGQLTPEGVLNAITQMASHQSTIDGIKAVVDLCTGQPS